MKQRSAAKFNSMLQSADTPNHLVLNWQWTQKSINVWQADKWEEIEYILVPNKFTWAINFCKSSFYIHFAYCPFACRIERDWHASEGNLQVSRKFHLLFFFFSFFISKFNFSSINVVWRQSETKQYTIHNVSMLRARVAIEKITINKL